MTERLQDIDIGLFKFARGIMVGYKNDTVISVPIRTQSPINGTRGAYPGAALLSPSRRTGGTGAVSGLFGDGGMMVSSSHNLSLNEFLDQQAQMVESGGLEMMTGLGREQVPALSLKTTFLDSFGSRPSSAIGMQQGSGGAVPAGVNSKSNMMVNFTNDVNQLCSWMAMLTPAQQNTVMDNLLSSLSEDVLRHTKSKLDSMTNSGYLSPYVRSIASPIPNRVAESGASTGLFSAPLPGLLLVDSVFDNHMNESASKMPSSSAGGLNSPHRRWSPNLQGFSTTQPMYDYLNEITRPRSADVNRMRPGQHYGHLNEGSGDFVDSNNGSQNLYFKRFLSQSSATVKSIGSSSVPSDSQKSVSQQTGVTSAATLNTGRRAGSAGVFTSSTTSSNTSNMNPKSFCDPKLLKNIPAWLKSLRLHKYSGLLDGKNWEELIELDDAALEEMGVSALGARRKLLKALAIVKDFKERGLIGEEAYSTL